MNWRTIRKAAEDQGWRVDETKKGFMLYPPDPTRSPVLVHRNPTEQALKEAVSDMRRQGFNWPLEKKRRAN